MQVVWCNHTRASSVVQSVKICGVKPLLHYASFVGFVKLNVIWGLYPCLLCKCIPVVLAHGGRDHKCEKAENDMWIQISTSKIISLRFALVPDHFFFVGYVFFLSTAIVTAGLLYLVLMFLSDTYMCVRTGSVSHSRAIQTITKTYWTAAKPQGRC